MDEPEVICHFSLVSYDIKIQIMQPEVPYPTSFYSDFKTDKAM
jgi:hypothetical protein